MAVEGVTGKKAQEDEQVRRDRLDAELRAAEQARQAKGPPPEKLQAEPSGTDKTAAAISAAQKQEERGQALAEFAGGRQTVVPPSVADTAQAARKDDDKHAELQKEEARRDNEREVRAAELQFQLAQQGRGLRG